MTLALADKVLAEKIWPAQGTTLRLKQVALVVAGIAVLAVSEKVQVPMWPSPVPVTLGTFAVLGLGASYGPRLGLMTILGYMILGLMGFDVFVGTSASHNGLAYMLGGTGGYLLGYVLATVALGLAARAGWDRSVWKMAGAMIVGNALIYLPGLAWLHHLIAGGMFDAAKYHSVWAQTLAWGATPYLIGDAMKLALAALLLPALWKLVGRARG